MIGLGCQMMFVLGYVIFGTYQAPMMSQWHSWKTEQHMQMILVSIDKLQLLMTPVEPSSFVAIVYIPH